MRWREVRPIQERANVTSVGGDGTELHVLYDEACEGQQPSSLSHIPSRAGRVHGIETRSFCRLPWAFVKAGGRLLVLLGRRYSKDSNNGWGPGTMSAMSGSIPGAGAAR